MPRKRRSAKPKPQPPTDLCSFGIVPGLPAEDDTRFGRIMPGWSHDAWLRRLRYMASVCVNETRAAELTEWADRVRELRDEKGT